MSMCELLDKKGIHAMKNDLQNNYQFYEFAFQNAENYSISIFVRLKRETLVAYDGNRLETLTSSCSHIRALFSVDCSTVICGMVDYYDDRLSRSFSFIVYFPLSITLSPLSYIEQLKLYVCVCRPNIEIST